MDPFTHTPRNKYNKMVFIMNALEQGWTIRKREDTFIFSKKHEDQREIFRDDYLEKFILSNIDERPSLPHVRYMIENYGNR
jgi:hypothetical protein